jgi:hypothetical protein
MEITFSLPASGSVLSSRQVLVSVEADGPGDVAMRVDVQDVWYPTRPAWSFVSKNTATVAVTVWAGAGGFDPHSVTSTSTATVARLRYL